MGVSLKSSQTPSKQHSEPARSDPEQSNSSTRFTDNLSSSNSLTPSRSPNLKYSSSFATYYSSTPAQLPSIPQLPTSISAPYVPWPTYQSVVYDPLPVRQGYGLNPSLPPRLAPPYMSTHFSPLYGPPPPPYGILPGPPNGLTIPQLYPYARPYTSSPIRSMPLPSSLLTANRSTRSDPAIATIPSQSSLSVSHPLRQVKSEGISRTSSGVTKVMKRSRKGCLTCRSRKRKCDEAKPVCYECSRLGIKCLWMATGSESRNKTKKDPHALRIDEVYNEEFGVIKIVRGKVDYKIEDGRVVQGTFSHQD